METLIALTKKMSLRRAGMTRKNRERLRAFDDPSHVGAFLALPQQVVDEVQREGIGNKSDALLVQTALAVEILLMAPVRIANLAHLSLDRNIVCSRSGKDAVIHLVFEPEEVKNNQRLEFPLPQETVTILDLYCERYRPRLVEVPHTYFAGGLGSRAEFDLPGYACTSFRRHCASWRLERGISNYCEASAAHFGP
jgi:integrase